MKNRRLPSTVLACLLSALLSAPAWSADSFKSPYPVSVLASVLFGVDGNASDFQVLDEEKLPAQFVQGIKSRFAKAHIPPQTDAGLPATFKTGVRLEILVSPNEGGGMVKIKSLHVEPLPIQRYFASYPDDIGRVNGWEGQVSAICVVGIAGLCTAIQVKAFPGMPDSVRRFAKASLEKWIFEPQELNGRPVEGQYTLNLSLKTREDLPVDFRVPKLDRILKGR